ncbi:type I polyketide synthase [Roseibium salinum]|nr:type I polyketide synthase [Roseibium salinum]
MIGRRCGVFVGCAHGDYQELFAEQPPGQAFWGNTTSLIPARISYWLDLKGPAVAVDTACSSSLVALHMACQSIRSGECDMALAGGVFVQCSPRFFRYANAAGMLSPSGRCAAFGKGADGIVPGEAVGAVLLRPLADARADGDTILGVIAASGTNQDGTTNGITAPSATSQERLIREVYQAAGIDPATIGLVEAHGTGTALGDPIEHAALVRAFFRRGPEGRPHLSRFREVEHRPCHHRGRDRGPCKGAPRPAAPRDPPTLHFAGGNPAIDFAGGPFSINGGTVAWPPRSGSRRRAAISSFGFSGTNAHVVIEEAPETQTLREPERGQLFVLSARTQEQLRNQAERLIDHLDKRPDLHAEDVAFTLIAGRRHLACRLAVVAGELGELQAALRAWLAGKAASGVETGQVTAGAEADSGDLRLRATGLNEPERASALAQLGRAYLSDQRLDPNDLFLRHPAEECRFRPIRLRARATGSVLPGRRKGGSSSRASRKRRWRKANPEQVSQRPAGRSRSPRLPP